MPGLLQLADFKWLMMACEGRRIDLDRMQSDRAYALENLRRAMHAQTDVVRHCAARLLRQIDPAACAAAHAIPAPAPMA